MDDRTYSIDINAPIQKVWDEITKVGSVCRPMFDTVMDGSFKPGSAYRYRNSKASHVFTKGKILEVDPPRKMVQTFQFTNIDEKPSLVTWNLSELPGGVTRITLVHSKFDGEQTFKAVNGGWPTILALYKSVCETGNIPLGKRFKHAMMGAMSFMIPKSMAAEKHPLGS